MIALDLGWFVCLILTSKMLPADYPMVSSHVLGEISEQQKNEAGASLYGAREQQMDEASKLLMLIEEQAAVIQTQAGRLRVLDESANISASVA